MIVDLRILIKVLETKNQLLRILAWAGADIFDCIKVFYNKSGLTDL